MRKHVTVTIRKNETLKDALARAFPNVPRDIVGVPDIECPVPEYLPKYFARIGGDIYVLPSDAISLLHGKIKPPCTLGLFQVNGNDLEAIL